MAQNEYLVDGADMTTVADAIRERGGTTAPLSFPAGMAEAVRNIQSGADLSLDITGATPGQIAKITAVDETGKPTKWEPVDISSGGTDISLGLTAATVGQTVKVKAVDAEGKPTAWEAVDAEGGGSETWEKIDVIPLTAGVTLYDIANFSGYTKIAISMVKPMTNDGSGTVKLYIYKKSNPDSSITSYTIESSLFKGAYGYIELAKDEPFLRYTQLYRNNLGTAATGGIGIPKDDLDLTDLGAVKIVLPEAYSQNFDGTGTLTIRGLK